MKIVWPTVAATLATAVPRPALHAAVTIFADGPQAEARGEWAVAFSGGADSLALLLLLWAHWPERRGELVALHFNHRLRGRASTADEAFCKRVCAALGVECVVGRWAESPPDASEAAARAARFTYFERVLAERGCGALWLGHQQDDVAESILMRLARGSGTAGLAAPRPVQSMPGRVHLRPLLTQKKTTLLAALTAAGGVWREDASNSTGDFFRNRIRLEVLPVWSEAAGGRDALAGIALSRDLLEDDDTALDTWAARVTRIDARGSLALRPLRGLPRAVLRRVIHRWLAQTPVKTDLNRNGFNGLLKLVQAGRTGTRHSLGAGHFALRRRTLVSCVRA